MDIYKKITEILDNRELKWDDDIYKFLFAKMGTESRLLFNNAAGGEKNLGIYQKMAKLGLLTADKMLVLDEPENHLHPAWQVKLAEIIATLVKNGVSVLLTSHSPDFIQALRIEADKAKLTNAKFYLSDKETGIISDKTENEADILDDLSVPMNGIYKYISDRIIEKANVGSKKQKDDD